MARPHCPRFLSGYCPSLKMCSLSHEKEDAPLCSAWRNGFCIGSRGNNCKYRHYYNDNDGAQLQAQKRLAELAVRAGTGGVGEAADYSSPLRVRILKEVERVRREEVDLDTGKRRSWLETNEYEVLDLCGETPPPPKQSRSLDSFCSAPATPPLAEISLNTVPGADQVWSTPPAGLGSPVHHSTPSLSRPALPGIVPVTAGSSGNTHPLAQLCSLQQDSIPADTCPVCRRQFKGAKGVKSHRNSKTSKCKEGLDKENSNSVAFTSSNKSTPFSSINPQPESSPNLLTSSVIEIEDSPEPRLRRSTRQSGSLFRSVDSWAGAGSVVVVPDTPPSRPASRAASRAARRV